jgi:hypothetical protein
MRKMTQPCSFEDGIVPDVIGPFLPIISTEVDQFYDGLSDDVDSFFASSICCCDYCYDDFVSHWPDVSFRDIDFQSQSMEMLWLIENSRIAEIYSPVELSTLRRVVKCPRCLKAAPYNVWIYEHQFSGAPEIEKAIDELLTLGSVTPFLLLEHAFAKRVLVAIRGCANNLIRSPLDVSLFRARLVEDVARLRQMPDKLETYAAAPSTFVGEGRYNHAGVPMVYLASSADTAAAELDAPGEECWVGRLHLIRKLQLLDLVNIDEETVDYDILLALAKSALIAAPRTGAGWVRRQYIFSRFVADCARSAGFDAIRYGSIKRSDQSNFVLLNPPDDFASIATLEGYETRLSTPAEKRY